ncbi:MAG: hypothetical protein AAGA12_00475 [Pseudomonadota bacterium]
MTSQGLIVGGEQIGRSTEQFVAVLKYAVVPESAWNSAAFKSNDVEQILAVADPRAVEIVGAMINDYRPHEFGGLPELVDNIALRKGVIDAMGAICSGGIDADYAEAVVGVPPTVGYLKNLEVLWTPGAGTGKGVLPGDLPFLPPDASWERLPSRSPWVGQAFVQKQDTKLSDALADIDPFRGECAGAFQLAIMSGCLNALGAEKVDALETAFGPAFLGIWSLPEVKTGRLTFTAASRFLTQLHDIPKDYERGSVLAVPGDYIYFQNKDDYPKLSPTGGWRGENCVYMGQDALGGPHYSGMGLAWKTEFALRMFLANAYFTDCNAQYLSDRRAGETPGSPPVIIEDRQAQVRFTKRAIMRYPDIPNDPTPKFSVPGVGPDFSDAEVELRLSQLGKRTDDGKGFVLENQNFGLVLNEFQISQSDLYPPSKSVIGTAELDVALGEWQFSFVPNTPGVTHLSLDDEVDVLAAKMPSRT